jgi:hypothetical protein
VFVLTRPAACDPDHFAEPMPSGPDAGLAKPPARTTYRRTFRLVRGLKTPELVIVDGAPGLEKALTALWSDIRGEARPMA